MFETNEASKQTKLTIQWGFCLSTATESLLLSDVEERHKLSHTCMKTSIFCARGDVFISALGRENVAPLSAVALDNL